MLLLGIIESGLFGQLIHYISCVACMYLGQLVENYRIEQKNILEDVIQIFSSCLGCKVWEGRTVRRKRERSVCSCIWKKLIKLHALHAFQWWLLQTGLKPLRPDLQNLIKYFPRGCLDYFTEWRLWLHGFKNSQCNISFLIRFGNDAKRTVKITFLTWLLV